MSLPANIEDYYTRLTPAQLQPGDARKLKDLDDRVNNSLSRLDPIVSAWKGTAPAGQVAAYDRVNGVMANDRRARAALAALLESGKLTESRASADGKSLLETLDEASRRTAIPPLRMEKLLADVVQEVADPVSINQGTRFTCTAAATQILMAVSDPAEYARIVTGLASGDGMVRLRDGQDIRREAQAELADDSLRTDSSRLYQDAVMQLEVFSPDLDYRNPLTTPPGEGQTTPPPLFRPDGVAVDPKQDAGFAIQPGVAKVLSALTGIPHEAVHGRFYREDRSAYIPNPEALKLIDRNLDAGKPLAVAINTSVAGHSSRQIVLVDKERGPDGHDGYLGINPWGMSHRFTRQDLEAITLGVVSPEAH